MASRTYEAVLSRPDNLTQVRQQIRMIERAGGRVRMNPPTPEGLVVVTLILPEGRVPAEFLPGLPFFPV
ncbi:MAG TPA: hypothetical protein VIG30_10905 [Ktedonobacterales bacterium]